MGDEIQKGRKTTLGADGEIFKHADRNKGTGNVHCKHTQNSFQGIITTLPIFCMHDKENVIKLQSH